MMMEGPGWQLNVRCIFSWDYFFCFGSLYGCPFVYLFRDRDCNDQ
jgi:hypothetical protein